MDTFMCRECNENCHGKAEDFTVCSACRVGYEAEIERLRELQKRDIAAARIRILEAEIERLREALGKICSLLSPTTGYWIARKALEDSIFSINLSSEMSDLVKKSADSP
jgi:hypothetical protein